MLEKKKSITRPNNDHYPTPPEFVRALFSVENFRGGIWEPCCGSGEMLEEIVRSNPNGTRGFLGSTIDTKEHLLSIGCQDAGFHVLTPNDGLSIMCEEDFLITKKSNQDNIITNPPYSIANDIVKHALSIDISGKVAMLLNVKWLTSLKRKNQIFDIDPPNRVWICSDRLAMYPKEWEGKKGAPTENYAWFIWDRSTKMKQPTMVGWLSLSEFKEA